MSITVGGKEYADMDAYKRSQGFSGYDPTIQTGFGASAATQVDADGNVIANRLSPYPADTQQRQYDRTQPDYEGSGSYAPTVGGQGISTLLPGLGVTTNTQDGLTYDEWVSAGGTGMTREQFDFMMGQTSNLHDIADNATDPKWDIDPTRTMSDYLTLIHELRADGMSEDDILSAIDAQKLADNGGTTQLDLESLVDPATPYDPTKSLIENEQIRSGVTPPDGTGDGVGPGGSVSAGEPPAPGKGGTKPEWWDSAIAGKGGGIGGGGGGNMPGWLPSPGFGDTNRYNQPGMFTGFGNYPSGLQPGGPPHWNSPQGPWNPYTRMYADDQTAGMAHGGVVRMARGGQSPMARPNEARGPNPMALQHANQNASFMRESALGRAPMPAPPTPPPTQMPAPGPVGVPPQDPMVAGQWRPGSPSPDGSGGWNDGSVNPDENFNWLTGTQLDQRDPSLPTPTLQPDQMTTGVYYPTEQEMQQSRDDYAARTGLTPDSPDWMQPVDTWGTNYSQMQDQFPMAPVGSDGTGGYQDTRLDPTQPFSYDNGGGYQGNLGDFGTAPTQGPITGSYNPTAPDGWYQYNPADSGSGFGDTLGGTEYGGEYDSPWSTGTGGYGMAGGGYTGKGGTGRY